MQRYGGPEACCMDKIGEAAFARVKPCCAIQKYRQEYFPSPNGPGGYWLGVRSLQIVTGKSLSNAGFLVESGGEEGELTQKSGYVAAPGGSAQLAQDARVGLTVETWVKDPKVHPMSGYVSTLVDSDVSDAGAKDYGFILGLGEEGKPEFRLSTDEAVKSVRVQAEEKVERNEWVHLAGTYDGAKIRLHVNGVEIASEDVSGEIRYHPDAALTLMRRTMLGQTAGMSSTMGEIDEVRVWRRPLTECQIKALMHVQPHQPFPRDLLVYYRMDGQAAPNVREICNELHGYRAYMFGESGWLDSDVPVDMGPETQKCRSDPGTGLRALEDEDQVSSAAAHSDFDFYSIDELGGCGTVEMTPELDTSLNISEIVEGYITSGNESTGVVEEPVGNATNATNVTDVPLWLLENEFEDEYNTSAFYGTADLDPIEHVADLKPILASCADSVADGDVHCQGDWCGETRDRFHGEVGQIYKVWCPAHCGTQKGDVYGPGDGSDSQEECAGFNSHGKKKVFLDASAICRSAVAVRALGQFTAGIVVFRLVDPVPSYPSCSNMPHATPGMPYNAINGHRGKGGGVSSKAMVWKDWGLADEGDMVEEFGGYDQCCNDTQPCRLGEEYNSSSHTCEWDGGYSLGNETSIQEIIQNMTEFMGVNDTAHFQWNETEYGHEDVEMVKGVEEVFNVSEAEAEIIVERGSQCSSIAKKRDCIAVEGCRMDTACGCIPQTCVCSDFACIYGQPADNGEDQGQVSAMGSEKGQGVSAKRRLLSFSSPRTKSETEMGRRKIAMRQSLAQLQDASAASGEGHPGGSGDGEGHSAGSSKEGEEEEAWSEAGYDDTLNQTTSEEGTVGVNASVEVQVGEEEEKEPMMRPTECCASQKFRQSYQGRTWMGVRAFEVDLTQSQGNDGIAAIDTNDKTSVDEADALHVTRGKEHSLGRTSGYAAVSHGSAMLKQDTGDAITVEAWVLDRGMRPYTAYVSTAVDSVAEEGEEEQVDYGFSLGIRDGQYTFELAGVNTKKFDRVSSPKWMTMAGRRRWTHIAGIYDGEYLHIVVDGSFTSHVKAGGGKINFKDFEPLHLMRYTLSGFSNQLPTLRGEMDEIRIWKRALRQCHLSAVMHRTIPAPLPQDLVVYFRMDGQAGPGSRRICSEGGRYTAVMMGELSWTQSSVPVWMLQTSQVCSVDVSTGLRSRFAVAEMPYGSHGYVNDTNFECGGGGGSGGSDVEVHTEVVKEYVTHYVHVPPVEVTKFVDRVHYINNTVVRYVDRPVVQYVDKPVIKYVPQPVPARPEEPPAHPDEDWKWIHRVRQQLSKPNGWAGHHYLSSAFEPLRPVKFDQSKPLPTVGKPLSRPAPSPKEMGTVEPRVPAPPAPVAHAEPSEGGGKKQYYWVADENGNILGPAQKGMVAAHNHAPETPIVVGQQPAVNHVYVQHVMQPRAQVVVQHHPVVVHVPPMTVSYKGDDEGEKARLGEVEEGGEQDKSSKVKGGDDEGVRLRGPADVKA